MNSIGNNLTAAAILSGRAGIKTEAEAEQQNPQLNTEDKVERSPANSDYKKMTALLPLSERGKQSIGFGAVIGGAVGGVGGALYGKSLAERKIITSNEIGEQTITWQEPVLQPENLGKIPTGYFSIGLADQSPHPELMQDVIENNPVMQDGKVLMREVSATYKNYGEPKVLQESVPIVQNTLSGYSEEVKPVTTTLKTITGGADIKDLNAKGDVTLNEELKGYNHKYSPTLTKTNMGYYDKPRVEFDNGVNVVGYTVIGGLIGVALGAVAGGIAGAVIEKSRLVKEAKEAGQHKPPKPTPKPPKPETPKA